MLETEYTNQGAIALYQQMGFIKDKRLFRYYLNGVDAFRLKLFCGQADVGMPSVEGTNVPLAPEHSSAHS